MKQPERLVLYINDLMLILGQSEKSCYRLTKKIKKKYGLTSRMFVPIDLFCEFTGIREESVRKLLF